ALCVGPYLRRDRFVSNHAVDLYRVFSGRSVTATASGAVSRHAKSLRTQPALEDNKTPSMQHIAGLHKLFKRMIKLNAGAVLLRIGDGYPARQHFTGCAPLPRVIA